MYHKLFRSTSTTRPSQHSRATLHHYSSAYILPTSSCFANYITNNRHSCHNHHSTCIRVTLHPYPTVHRNPLLAIQCIYYVNHDRHPNWHHARITLSIHQPPRICIVSHSITHRVCTYIPTSSLIHVRSSLSVTSSRLSCLYLWKGYHTLHHTEGSLPYSSIHLSYLSTQYATYFILPHTFYTPYPALRHDSHLSLIHINRYSHAPDYSSQFRTQTLPRLSLF